MGFIMIKKTNFSIYLNSLALQRLCRLLLISSFIYSPFANANDISKVFRQEKLESPVLSTDIPSDLNTIVESLKDYEHKQLIYALTLDGLTACLYGHLIFPQNK